MIGNKQTEVIEIIKNAFEEIMELKEEYRKLKEINEITPIFGKDALFDSMDLVYFLVTVEEKVRNKYNVSISLTDEKAMSQRNTPFKNVKTLSEYIINILEEKRE